VDPITPFQRSFLVMSVNGCQSVRLLSFGPVFWCLPVHSINWRKRKWETANIHTFAQEKPFHLMQFVAVVVTTRECDGYTTKKAAQI